MSRVFRRQLVHRAIIDDGAELSAGGVDLRSFGRNFHDFLRRTDLQNRVERDYLIDIHKHAGLHILLETSQLKFDAIAARHDFHKIKIAACICLSVATGAGRLIYQRDLYVRENSARGISDTPDDPATGALGERRKSEKAECEQESQRTMRQRRMH